VNSLSLFPSTLWLRVCVLCTVIVHVQGEADVGNFDEQFTSERPVDSVVDSRLSETAKKTSTFDGFTFVAPTALTKE